MNVLELESDLGHPGGALGWPWSVWKTKGESGVWSCWRKMDQRVRGKGDIMRN